MCNRSNLGENSMGKHFRAYNVDQQLLLPPDLRKWLPEKHLSFYVSDLIESFDLTEILKSYEVNSLRGFPPFDPRLLLKVLVYGYCIGVRSSRKLEQATYNDIAFRVLSADQHPDHATISSFRLRHLDALEGLFKQVLLLSKKADLVSLGHVSLDGTKMKANAKKSLSRKYDEVVRSEEKLGALVKQILREAQEVDEAEDKLYGKGNRGDEMPECLSTHEKRLETIMRLKKEMEAEAKERAEELRLEKERKIEEDKKWEEETGQHVSRRYPKVSKEGESATVAESRRNPTDYDARIMKDSATGGFILGYNAQAVVDEKNRIILATDVSQNNDKQLLVPMLKLVEKNTGKMPEICSADAGYWGERDVIEAARHNVDTLIPPPKEAKGKRIVPININGRSLTVTEYMAEKLATLKGKTLYRKRKTIPEPVFGIIKSARGIRQFLLRGLKKVKNEWSLICMTQNIRVLHTATTREVAYIGTG